MKRKQRYALDADDLIRSAFFTKENAELTLNGLTQSETTVALGVLAGGTGSLGYNPEEIIYYDAAERRLKGSGYTKDVLAAVTGDMLGAAFHTGVKLEDTTVDVITDLTGNYIEVMTSNFTLEGNTIWAAFRVVFNFTVAHASLGTEVVNDIRMTLGADGINDTVYVSSKSGPFVTTYNNSEYQVTWIAEGVINTLVNASHQEANSLVVRVWMKGGTGDVKTERSGYVRLEDRGLNANRVPAPEIHGVPTFIAPVELYNGVGPQNWTATINFAAYVPDTATAVLLDVGGQCAGPDGYPVFYVWVRKDVGESAYRLGGFRSGGSSDQTGAAGQGIFPFKTDGVSSTVQLMLSENFAAPMSGHALTGGGSPQNPYVQVRLIGYIS